MPAFFLLPEDGKSLQAQAEDCGGCGKVYHPQLDLVSRLLRGGNIIRLWNCIGCGKRHNQLRLIEARGSS